MVDLTPYKDKPILVRFRLNGVYGGADGWYIDDVAIYDTAPPPCRPGDCDCNGTVTIAEAQTAINMYLGLMVPSVCVDVNKDGKVTIDEVQKVINGYLGL